MRILVFGASGSTGSEVVKQGLEQGHSITAFVRSPSKLPIESSSLKVMQGDVADSNAVTAAVGGHDAVVSALGVSIPTKHDPAVIAGVKNIITAMEAASVRRLLYLSFIGVRESRNAVGFVLRYIAPVPLRHEISDHEEKERLIMSSNLNWTIVRPPKLTSGPRTGKYRSGEEIRTFAPVPLMSRADVADFMLREAAEGAFIRRKPRLLR
jgi:putative NADH-flavin reductase